MLGNHGVKPTRLSVIEVTRLASANNSATMRSFRDMSMPALDRERSPKMHRARETAPGTSIFLLLSPRVIFI
jgi:hypothetical protein